MVGPNGIPAGRLILAPETTYRQWLYDTGTGLIGYRDFTTPTAGRAFTIPPVPLGVGVSLDSDDDGLSDDAEFVLGSDPSRADTDGDGISDGASLQLGILPGRGAITGVIGSVETGGNAEDICAADDLIVVANGDRGVTVFNVFNRMVPLAIAQIDTPGTATAVACSGGLIAVADGPRGLAVIDIGDPPNGRILHQIEVGGSVHSVAAGGGIAYAGTSSGEVVVVDLGMGVELSRGAVPGGVSRVGLEGDFVYVLTGNALHAFRAVDERLELRGSLAISGVPPLQESMRSLFVGGRRAYIGHSTGLWIVDLGDPVAMRTIGNSATATGFYAMATSGSGQLVTVTTGLGGGRALSLYDVSQGVGPAPFITSMPLSGTGSALALYSGLAYVATRSTGLQVVRYLAADVGRTNPSIFLNTSFALTGGTNGVVEEGRPVLITASVGDDVQVRNVEFYIDGVKVATDGNFPFEHRFTAPPLSRQRSFRFQARASDTGGNFAWSDLLTVELQRDTTPPAIRRTSPGKDAIADMPEAILVFLSETVDPSRLNSDTFRVTWAGPDHRLGTGDDQPVPAASIGYRESLRAGVFSPGSPLTNGLYRLLLTAEVADPAGNRLAPYDASFWTLRGGASGDVDSDGLTNSLEVAQGFKPTVSDSDQDGWDDGVEFVEGAGFVTDSKLFPRITVASAPPVAVQIPGREDMGLTGIPTRLASPPVTVRLPGDGEMGTPGIVTIASRPPVTITLPDETKTGDLGRAIHIGRPPITVGMAGIEDQGVMGKPLLLARPPVTILATNLPSPPQAQNLLRVVPAREP